MSAAENHQLKALTAKGPPFEVVPGIADDGNPRIRRFAARPLRGATVLVTRPAAQTDSLRTLLAERGARVVFQPAIHIGPPDDWAPVDEVLSRLDEFDWIVFSSSNGVQYFLDRLKTTGRQGRGQGRAATPVNCRTRIAANPLITDVEPDLRALERLKLAAIGPATAEELGKYQLPADRVPAEFRAESLADALRDEAARGARFLLVRASRGRETLAERLAAAGGSVTQVVAYASTDPPAPDAEVLRQLSRGEIDWVTVTSSAIARSLARMFADELRQSRLASISPVTSDTLRQLGFEPHVEAGVYTMQGVVDAMAAFDGK